MKSSNIGVLIRFSNSEATLPTVLAALKQQTLQPDILLGINSGGTDSSSDLICAAGGSVVDWTQPYAHATVLNFGISLLHTELILILSSHTVLESSETLAQMAATMQNPKVACTSLKWNDDPFYSNAVDWAELQQKGLRFGSIYSNSMGLIRRVLWETAPFDETLPTAEDSAWAIGQLKNGYLCCRLPLPFGYRRGGVTRDADFAQVTFTCAFRHGLKVVWLGPIGSIKLLAQARLLQFFLRQPPDDPSTVQAVQDRLVAWWHRMKR